MTKVSVCIAQYNRCEALRLALQDLLNQTYTDFELLICDDASTDATPPVVAEFRDSRIRYVRNQRNLGLYPNFNRCIGLAQGEYIAVYHNHDRYAPDIVERSVKMLDAYPQAGFVHTGTASRAPESLYDRSYVRDWPAVADGRWFVKHLIRRWDTPIHQPTVMARRCMYEQVGGYDDVTYGAVADHAVWIKMCMIADVAYIPLPLMRLTPRTVNDTYGQFNWADLVGMARAHELGVRLLYATQPLAEQHRQLVNVRRERDTVFLMRLAQWIAKGRMEVAARGLEVIYLECSPKTIHLAKTLVSTASLCQLPLRFVAKGYRAYAVLAGRFESERGHSIARRSRHSS